MPAARSSVTAALTRDLTLAVGPSVWLCMIGLGLIGTATGYALFFKGLQGLGPVRTAIISTTEPFWAALLGWLILAQPVMPGTVVGGLLIAIAVVRLQWPQKKADLPAHPAVT
ncbi:MAG: EamA family transporter [Gemmatimonadaceae bacterium]